jgi:hypothetical protein
MSSNNSINCFVFFYSCRATVRKKPKIEKGLKEVPLANWPIVDIKKQDTMFFSTVRKLNFFCLDPKYNLESKHVITKECWFLFEGSRKFKMKHYNKRCPYTPSDFTGF